MRPVVALIGRPNVGKSTLFNRLCGARTALVADHPGLTRDRHYGTATLAGRAVTLIDTGGIAEMPAAQTAVADAMAAQVELALDEADVAVLVADARSGPTVADADIALRLRRRNAAVVLVANKIDGTRADACHAFAEFGYGSALPVSAAHGRGVGDLAAAIAALLPDADDAEPADAGDAESGGIRVAVVGRPNVGKSTLVNRLEGSERQIVHDAPGTTRDAIEVPIGGYVLIDTAGVRRKGRTTEMVEKFSIVKTLAALQRAEVAVLVADAREGLVDQDMHILEYALDAGAGVVLALNKWDALDAGERTRIRASLDRRLAFAPWIPVRTISALRGRGINRLLADADAIHRSGAFDVKTAELNRILEAAVAAHPPPTVRGRRVKLRYAHKTGGHPPTILLHGTQSESLPSAYLRYLAGRFRDELQLVGVPVRIETRAPENPFADRRNTLTPRQIRRRKRLIRHHRGRSR